MKYLPAIFLLAAGLGGQTPNATFHADVHEVEIDFNVKDSRGRHISNIRPEDVEILEDGVPQSLTSFAAPEILESRSRAVGARSPHSVFILLNSSNSMYASWGHVTDAVSNFVRSLPQNTAVAIYTFTRNLRRVEPLSLDRNRQLAAVRSATAGDDPAVYDCLLLTLRDAAKEPGRKMVVVFTNGPDAASILAPDDVARFAQEEGVPVHIIHTGIFDEANVAALSRVAAMTGGTNQEATAWPRQAAVLSAIRADIANSYVLTYRPSRNTNNGFRRITIALKSDPSRHFRITARPGYHARVLTHYARDASRQPAIAHR